MWISVIGLVCLTEYKVPQPERLQSKLPPPNVARISHFPYDNLCLHIHKRYRYAFQQVWVHTCNVTAYRNTVLWQCGRDTCPRNVSKVGYPVNLRAFSVCCRYLAVASKGWYGNGRSRCGRATWRYSDAMHLMLVLSFLIEHRVLLYVLKIEYQHIKQENIERRRYSFKGLE
jgi:hypothetical protein